MTQDNLKSLLQTMAYRTLNRLRDTHEINEVSNGRIESIADEFYSEIKDIFFKDETIQP